MKYATKKSAKEIIAHEKEHRETAYFEGTLTFKEMKEMFIYRFHFGEAEANVILASLVNAGAKFIIED